jgi:hypothetical protein
MSARNTLRGNRTFGNGGRRSSPLLRQILPGVTLLLSGIVFPVNSLCDTTISIEARPNPSQVFLDQGIITIHYTIPLTFLGTQTDGGGPSNTGNTVRILVSTGSVDLAVQQIANLTFTQVDVPALIFGTFSFYNPSSQFLQISGFGGYEREVPRVIPSIYPAFQQWIVFNGRTTIVGGDTPPGLPQTPPAFQSPRLPPATAPSNVHAVIISGLSDPTKVIASPNVIVTGGIVALGKDVSPAPAASAWSPGLRIVPDYGLLTGEKIPPVTPNILDVRIVRQEVTADFPSPNPQPDN